MSASCVDRDCVSPLAVRHYNFLRGIVLALLAALLLGLLGRSCAAAALAAPTIRVPDGTIESQAVTLTGTGAPNSRVMVELNGEEIGIANVDANGEWSLTTDTLPDGDYTARAATINPEDGGLLFAQTAGDWSVGSAVVDTPDDDVDVAAPIAALAALGGLTLADFAADGDLTLGNFAWSGTGEPGATVELLANGEVLDRATVDADGNWEFAGDYSFAPGDDVDFSARMVGADGADLGSIDGTMVSIPDLSMTEAVAPTLMLDGTADVMEGDSVTFSGTAAPNAEIEILVDGEVVDTVSADADGNFTYTIDALTAGDYTLSARNVDNGLEAETVALTIGAVAAAATPPVLSRIFGGNSADEPIAFSGSADPDREVEIFVDGESVGTVVTDADGNFTLSTPIAAGDHVVEVRYVDDDSVVSNEQAFTVADVNGVGPAITDATANDDGTVNVSGTAPAGSTVEITSGGEVIETVVADDDGNFSATVTLPDDNDNTVGAQTTDDGVTVGFDSAPITGEVMADAGDNDASGSDDSADSNTTGDDDDATGSTDGDGTDDDDDSATDSGGSDTVLVTNVAPVTDENGDAPTIGTVGFGMSGTGRPGELVIVLEDGVQVGGATVQVDGTWSCTCILPPGEHTLIVQEADNPDNQSEPITFVVENLTEAPTPPRAAPGEMPTTFTCKGDPPNGEIRGQIYIVAQCEWLGLIAQRLGTTVEKMMEYNPQLAAPNQIYPGQALNIPSDAGCFDNAGG